MHYYYYYYYYYWGCFGVLGGLSDDRLPGALWFSLPVLAGLSGPSRVAGTVERGEGGRVASNGDVIGGNFGMDVDRGACPAIFAGVGVAGVFGT